MAHKSNMFGLINMNKYTKRKRQTIYKTHSTNDYAAAEIQEVIERGESKYITV